MSASPDLERKLDQLLKDPCDCQLFNDVGVLLHQKSDFANAEKYLQRAYELCPKDEDILFNYASLLFLQSKWRDAVKVLQCSLEIHSPAKETFQLLRDCYYQLGEYDLATMVCEQDQSPEGGT